MSGDVRFNSEPAEPNTMLILGGLQPGPNLSFLDVANQSGADTVADSKHSALFTRLQNGARLFFGKLGVRRLDAFGVVSALSALTICRVFCWRPPAQMRRVHAAWIVARMKSAVAWARSPYSGDKKGCLMGFEARLGAYAEEAISLSTEAFAPIPAMIWTSDFNRRPKTGLIEFANLFYEWVSHCAVPSREGQGRAVLQASLRPANDSAFPAMREVA